MKTVPSTIATKERWVQIAGLVDEKTPKECFTRFKELCAAAKAAAAKWIIFYLLTSENLIKKFTFKT